MLRSLRQGDHRKALQLNDYVVVHIDTDVSEEPGYGVPRRAADGRALSPEELVEQVRLRLVTEMGVAFHEEHGARVVFAIAVDAIECWLLPLLYDGEPAAKKAKTTGCLKAADDKLRRLNLPLLSKSPASYDRASRDYAKHRTLILHRDENPSLDIFVKNLEALAAAKPADAGKPDEAAPVPPAGGDPPGSATEP